MKTKYLILAAVGIAGASLSTGANAQSTNPCPAGSNPVFVPTPTNPSAFTCVANTSGTAQGQGSAGIYATEPRYGSPNSMQFQAVSASLDLFSFEPEGADAFLPEGDADTIGGAFTYFDAGDQTGQRYEGHYQHARRIGEGTRARFLVDVPVAALVANHFTSGGAPLGGGTAVYGTVNAGIELPIRPFWLITPRVAYSNLQAGQDYAGDGELATASVTSRYKFEQVGRGDLVIGNMVAYSHTAKTFLSRQPGFADADIWTLRNGVAYQLPIKKRMFGRQMSVRGSYVYTYTDGEPGLAFKEVHEVGLNFGVRTREAEQKNGFEQMRIGLLYTHGNNEFGGGKADYDAGTITLGYRF